MAKEREHKFLVVSNSFMEMQTSQSEIVQGYLCLTPEHTVRVRICDDKASLTIKGLTRGDSRDEFEYQIPISDARKMLEMCGSNIIKKIRHIVPFENYIWEVDEFLGDLKPLIIAEIEISETTKTYPLPPFVGENVTSDSRYYNSNLVARLKNDFNK